MIRFLGDENFNGPAYAMLIKLLPPGSLVRVQDVGLTAVKDEVILEWATTDDRFLLTHDINTMKKFAEERLADGRTLVGVFLIPQWLPIRKIVSEIETIALCSEAEEWRSLVVFLPL